VADQFVCTVTDGWGGTNFQTISISVIPPEDPAPNITSITANQDGTFTLNASGAPGLTYVFESTPDVLPPAVWEPIATNTLGTNGLWQFTDSQSTNFPQRFYRLKLAQ